ncbi:MAG TPA: hypothetical protein VML91_27675 [Burkholderiales bacterium]|nr:hypothetical protein [Burkholderiales bacterium]
MRTALALLLAAAAGLVHAQDPTARALLQRQQQSDDFSLQLQQSIQSFRAGPMTPQQRLDFDALQRGQRMQQDELNYRQQIQQGQPTGGSDALRRAEMLRFEQERQNQLSRFRSEGEPPPPAPTRAPPLVEPGVATAPVPRQIRIPEGDSGGWVEWKGP